MDTLVTTNWLSQHIDDPDLVVLDCTVGMETDNEGVMTRISGQPEYEAGHIPSTGFADLTGDLCDGDSPFDFAMPAVTQFCDAMGALGVGDDSQVVLYDGGGSMWAARVWWMLRWAGFDRAAILDGGLNLWKAEDRPISTEPPNRTARVLTPAIRPELIAGQDEVLAAIEDDAVCLIDTMPEEHYRGEWSIYGRPGHIPGASNTSAMALIDESGRYLPHEELAALHAGDRDARTITYCGGGIAASSGAFVMTRLGFTDLAVYTASLQEWAAEASNPMVVGTA